MNAMNTRNQLICAHTTPVIMVMTLIGLFLLPGWLPPPPPTLPADALVQMFSGNTRLRIGMELLMLSSPLFIGISVAIAAQLRRIEGPHHVLADLQLMASVLGVIAVELPAFFWLAISYRPGTPAAIIMVFNDLSWFMIIGGIGTAILQNLCVGICILNDTTGKHIYPRWLGFWSIWLGLADLPGALIPFFQTGPFTWTGLLGFWVVVTAFFTWLVLIYVYTVIAINRQAREGI
jgi:hypothetical protein